MNMMRGFGESWDRGRDDDLDLWQEDADVGAETPPGIGPGIGNDERRLQVRAYNYWVSLLKGRSFPSIEDVEPDSLGEFGPNSVLLDFSAGLENPAIILLGKALRDECGIEQEVSMISDVPARSLLSRLTDHYLQIVANRVPVGFEAEFTNQRGVEILYRGILMPFSSNGRDIDFIYGVMNWKERADPQTETALSIEMDRSFRDAAPARAAVPIWEDGPNVRPRRSPAPDAGRSDGGAQETDETEELAERLAAAREGDDMARTAERRSRGALHRALSLAYDFALLAQARPDAFAELVADAGLKSAPRAPAPAVVKLVFGAGHDRARLAAFAAALAEGLHRKLPPGGFTAWLESQPGGLKGAVEAARARKRAERAARPAADRDAKVRAALRALPTRGTIALAGDETAAPTEKGGEEEFVLLVARRLRQGRVGVVAALAGDEALLARALRHAVRRPAAREGRTPQIRG